MRPPLTDGPVTIQVDVTDGAGNMASFGPFAGTKDIVAPDAPTNIAVSMGADNAADLINMNNVASTILNLTWGASQAVTDSGVVTLTSDGGGTAMSAAANPSAGGATDTLTGFSTAAMTDGNVTLSIVVTDLAGNTSSFTDPDLAVKDIAGPATPTSADHPGRRVQ